MPAPIAMTAEEARIAVVVPAYNEETQIGGVIDTMPAFVDDIVIVDDKSRDTTVEVVEKRMVDDPRITLICLEENSGVGAAIGAGYKWAAAQDVDLAVVVAGDGQMDPAEMIDVVAPVLEGRADYTKGNRLQPTVWRDIPRLRLLGNSVLSMLTKIVTGYWSLADFQSGYTAASRYLLQNVDWDRIYPRYGFPNDVLVHANILECRVADVPIRPLYGVGERTSMRVLTVIFTIAMLLFRRFWWRLGVKYMLRDFHPLVFFYLLASLTGIGTLALTVRLLWIWIGQGFVPQVTALGVAFLAVTTLNSTFFAFWMDKEANSHLTVAQNGRRIPPARSA